MTTETGKLPAMVEEGLAYFDGAGDAGDKLYVKAIREHIEALARDRAAQGAEPDGYTSYGEFRWACDCDERMRREWTPLYTRPPVAGDAERKSEIVRRAIAHMRANPPASDQFVYDEELAAILAELRPPAGDAQARTARAVATKGRYCGKGCDESNCCMDPGPAGDAQARVDEAMVERAFGAYWAYPEDHTNRGDDREAMRAALTAALGGRDEVA